LNEAHGTNVGLIEDRQISAIRGANSDNKSAMVRFRILVPKGCLLGSVYSVIDVLREVNSLAAARAGRRVAMPLSWQLIDCSGQSVSARYVCYASHQERAAARARPDEQVVVVPPLMMITIPGLRRLVQQNAGAGKLLREACAQQQWIAGCGLGLWILGKSGLLAHQPTPLSWLYQSGFIADFPQVPVESEHPIAVGRQMVLASSPSHIHEMTLKVLEALGLSDLAGAARDKFCANPERQHLVQTIPEQVVGVSRDAPLHRAIAWMEAHAGESVAMGDVAKAAAVSERTLVRLFQRHLGKPPLRFLNEIRVKRAQMWLQVTWRSVHEIAQASGYGEPAAFRRMFHQVTGMTPAEYRRRFTMRTPRAVWQLERFDDVLT
jgi:transcriptional regulator GlxA family with amidase domain